MRLDLQAGSGVGVLEVAQYFAASQLRQTELLLRSRVPRAITVEKMNSPASLADRRETPCGADIFVEGYVHGID